jgi:Glycosyltransferase family 87
VTPQRIRAIRHGLLLAGVALLAFILVGTWRTATESSAGEAYDAFAYWQAAHDVDPYARPVLGSPVAYYYSPAFLQVFAPILALSFPVFLAAWYLLNGAALVVVARSWLPVALVTGFVALEVLRGNIETLMALAIVAGFRWPAAWAFILLTKVTPGVGLLYFVGRREWRSLAIAMGATLAIAGISFVFAPSQWFAWVSSLITNAGVSIPWPYFPVPLVVRLPIAAALALLAGVRGWKWMVPIASTLAMPALWPVNLTLLVAIFPLLPRPAERHAVVKTSSTPTLEAA